MITWMADVQRRCSGLVINSMFVLARAGPYEAESVAAFVHLEHSMVSFSIGVRLCCKIFDDIPNTVARSLSCLVHPGNVRCMLNSPLLEETLYSVSAGEWSSHGAKLFRTYC